MTCSRYFTQNRKTIIGIVILFSSLLRAYPSQAIESRKIDKMIEEAQPLIKKIDTIRERQKILKQGKINYLKFCIHCHGPKGKGNGQASYHLFPKPRELSQGIYKFHATQTNTLPLDKDLIRTIKIGIAGTTMPGWGEILDNGSILALVEYIKTFSGRFGMELPGREISISLEPPYDNLSIAHGKKLYKELRCGKCHGEEGRKEGKLSEINKNFSGSQSFVYSLSRKKYYKSGSSGIDIYKMLATGLDGSPMNAYDYLSNVERWNLVHFLQSKHKKKNKNHSSTVKQIISKNTNRPITLNIKESAWEGASETIVNLFPIRARKNPIDDVAIQSIYNKNKIAIKMRWKDPTPDSILQKKYVDQSAIQFAIGNRHITDSPFYGMGEKNKPVNIWHWKADAKQKIIQNTDSDINHYGQPFDLPSRMFLNPFKESPVEEINSKGIGTLTVQPLKDQQVEGRGYWQNGVWNVIFIRELETLSKRDISFKVKRKILLAFALWDGDKKDMNANKMVSFWQVLSLR